jgi:DNA modification methylase
MTPYYQEPGITIYHGDCREVLDWRAADVLLTDPPYGIYYHSGARRLEGNACSIIGDEDTILRDFVLSVWKGPALVFGTWRVPKPAHTRGVLVWDKGGALGMGDLSLPWKFDHEEIYVLGSGFVGSRDSGSVLRCAPEQSIGRAHPHQKPVHLITRLLTKCPAGIVSDPFMGVGTTLRAAKDLGRQAIGIEIEERYCEIAVNRLRQGVLPLAIGE